MDYHDHRKILNLVLNGTPVRITDNKIGEICHYVGRYAKSKEPRRVKVVRGIWGGGDGKYQIETENGDLRWADGSELSEPLDIST